METTELVVNQIGDQNPAIKTFDLRSVFKKAYSEYYKTEQDDSPPETRLALYKRIQPAFSVLPAGSSVLDVGSGRQIFEQEYAQMLTAEQLIGQPELHADNTAKIYTLDFADIDEEQLLAADNPNVTHVRGSAEHMEFPDESFDLAFSNLALDFMPPEAIHELWRVLKPDAKALINLHHPAWIIPTDIDDQVRKTNRQVKQQRKFAGRVDPSKQHELEVLRIKKAQKDDQTLYSVPDDIAEKFSQAGFTIDRLEEIRIPNYQYWIVDIKKLPSLSQSADVANFAAD